MSGYKTHLYITELTKQYGKVKPIAISDNKYINYLIISVFGNAVLDLEMSLIKMEYLENL